MSSVKIKGSPTGTAAFTIAVPDGTSTDRTIELPDAAGSFVLADASGDVTVSGALNANDITLSDADTPTLTLTDTTNTLSTFVQSGNTTAVIGTSTNHDFRFFTNNTEAARIDSSQSLLVGKTSGGSISTLGNEISQTYAMHSRDDGTPLFIGRSGTSGDMIAFYNGTTSPSSHHGGIRTDGRIIIYDRYAGGIRFGATAAGVMQLTPQNAAGTGGVDNQHDIGASSLRWDDIYATNGTIQTSDLNLKTAISSLTDAEITAAKAISKLFKTFKWNDKVEAKGDAARTHTGVIAQEVQQAMTDAGLDVGNYAFFTSATWWEVEEVLPATDEYEEHTVTHQFATLEEAPAGAVERTRLGIRYPELLAFIGAATEQRLASIEARLDALEAV